MLSEVGVGLAFSPGSSETAFLLVPVLQKEVTNRSQAEEVLRISPDTKQNKNRSVCLVCKANMDPAWWFWPYLPLKGGENQIWESQAPVGAFKVLLGSWYNFKDSEFPRDYSEVGKILARWRGQQLPSNKHNWWCHPQGDNFTYESQFNSELK